MRQIGTIARWGRGGARRSPARRRFSTLLTALVVTVLVFGSASAPTALGQPRRAPASQQVLRVALREPTHLDPALVYSESELWAVMALFDPLVTVDDQTGRIVPVAARSWDVSRDGLTYTFHLRPGMVWSDGRGVTAADYEYAWKRVVSPALRSPYASALYPIRGAREYHQGQTRDPNTIGVRAVDRLTLRVRLAEPAAYFPKVVATWTFLPVPRRQIAARGARWEEAGSLVGNGPFVLARWDRGRQMVLRANPRYRGTRPVLQQVRFEFTTASAPAGVEAFRGDRVDVSFQLLPKDLDAVRAAPALNRQLVTFPGAGTLFVAFDTGNAASPFSNVKVRQALYLAIDRGRLAKEIMKGLVAPASTIEPPGRGRAAAVPLTGGAERARRLLAEAGYPEGRGFPKTTLVWPGDEPMDSVAPAVIQMWRETLNIQVTPNQISPGAFSAAFRSWAKQPYSAYLEGWALDYNDPYNWANVLFDSRQDLLHTRWSNERYDTLVRGGARERDAAKRGALYRDARRILDTELPVIPLYHISRTVLVKPWVQGFVYSSTGVGFFSMLRKTWIAAR